MKEEVKMEEGRAVDPQQRPKRREAARPNRERVGRDMPDWTISSIVSPANSTMMSDEGTIVPTSPPTPPALPPPSTTRGPGTSSSVKVAAVVEPAPPLDDSTAATNDFRTALLSMHDQILAAGRLKRERGILF